MPRTSRELGVWAAIAAVFAAPSACAEEDHTDWGGLNLDGGAGGGGGGGGGITQEDGGDAADTDDTDTESSTSETECKEDEVSGPDGDLCWRRCPVGQDWVDAVCVGSVYYRAWSEAATACNSMGSAYRTATRDEMVGLLGDCDADVVDTNSEGLCDPCIQSTVCFEMFEFDFNTYWTSTATAPDAFTDPLPWAVSFDVGTVFQYANAEELFAFRCVRQGG